MNKKEQKDLIEKLVNITKSIQSTNSYKAFEEHLENLADCMKEMKEAKFYDDVAEVFLTAIERLKEGKITRVELVEKLTIFIKMLKLEVNPLKAEIAEKCEEVYNEAKEVCSKAVTVAKETSKKAQVSFEANKPKYVEKANEVKAIAKKMERRLKTGIRNWLNDDDEE